MEILDKVDKNRYKGIILYSILKKKIRLLLFIGRNTIIQF